MLIFAEWDQFAGPFRFLTVWALFFSFFSFSRMMAIEEQRSSKRWDGVVSMTAVLNSMVVILYWRLYFADPASVTRDGQLAAWHLEMYLHALGPALHLIDSLFIHRSFRRLGAAAAWLIGVITAYVALAEFGLQARNVLPAGEVTSGLPYPFLNDMILADRAVFYGANLGVAIALLLIYTAICYGVRRIFPVPEVPEAPFDSRDKAASHPDHP